MTPLSAFTRYTSSFIGATLLTSVAVHGVIHRRTSTAERDRLAAHTSILESLVARLKAGEDVDQAEIGRLLRLARGEDGGQVGAQVRDVSWGEVVFGRKVSEDEGLEAARREWDAAVAQDLSNDTKPAAEPTPPPVSPGPSPQTPVKRPTFF